jgi:signal transduction histidine kinase/CheY-like chemotaxis protein
MSEIWPTMWQSLTQSAQKVLTTGEGVALHNQRLLMEREGGLVESFWYYSFAPIFGDTGAVEGIALTAFDSTERVLAERQIISERERLNEMFNQAPGFMAMLRGANHVFELTNSAYMQLIGHRDVVGIPVRTALPEVEGQGFFELLDEVYATSKPFVGRSMLIDLQRMPGAAVERRYVDLVYQPVTDADGKVSGIFVEGADVTERVAAETELKQSEKQYRTLFEAIDAGFCVVEMKFDEDGRPVDYRLAEINPAFERQTGLHGAEGKWVSKAVPGLEPHWFEAYGRVARTGEAVRFENFAEPFGRWYDVHAFRTGEAEDHKVAILFNDITARKNAEDQLRLLNATLEARVAEEVAERNMLATIVEATDVMVMACDFDYNVLATNKANTDEFERIYGIRPKAGDNMLALLDNQPEHREQVRVGWGRALAADQLTIVEEFGESERARPHYEVTFRSLLNETGEKIGAYQLARDVSERLREQARLVQTQEALRQSQKLEAMGQLTGGVSHDFNNLLTPIIGSLDMLHRKGIGTDRERRLIDGALQSAERAKTLVQRLLAFARRQPLRAGAVDIAALINGIADLVASTSGPRVKLELDLDPDVPAAVADQNQLEMAILNLAVNARDAMPEGGTLTIASRVETVSANHPMKLSPGIFVRLSVADTGAGMDQETVVRAIEPFFSTKGIGKGTGLGLSMVHGLANQLGGALDIKSYLGVGTKVELWLPASSEEAAALEKPLSHSLPEVVGTVLLVDDEELVRMSTADMLSELGFRVVEAGSAHEALRLLDDGNGFSLIVTDHLMPGMTGVELVRTLKERGISVPALVVSGYAEVEDIAPDLALLVKPFRQADLAHQIAQLAKLGLSPRSS